MWKEWDGLGSVAISETEASEIDDPQSERLDQNLKVVLIRPPKLLKLWPLSFCRAPRGALR